MKRLNVHLLSILLWFAPSAIQAEVLAGKIGYTSGAIIAQRTNGTIKVLSPKADVFEGDTLVTASDCYAQVIMNDGTKMTIRPDSNLKIDRYIFDSNLPKADSAIYSLLKGGFRTVTGLIGKRGNTDAYQLRASTSTIGIRGTDFSSRLCAVKDCEDDPDLTKTIKPKIESKEVAGRVIQIEGNLSVKAKIGKERNLVQGAPIYEGDTLKSNESSKAIVVFRDGARITLQSNSAFMVENFRFHNVVQEDNAVIRLFKGTVRVATGLIGRINHENFRFSMSGATIGIRGTGFDAWCNGPCADESINYGATSGNPLNGAGVYVWSGEVIFSSAGTSNTVTTNQMSFISRQTGKPSSLIQIPESITNNPNPKPDSVPVDMEKLFDEKTSSGEPGLYVTVHDGQIVLANSGQKMDLGRGESGYSGDQIIVRLSTTPGFMSSNNKMLESIGNNNGQHTGVSNNACMVGE